MNKKVLVFTAVGFEAVGVVAACVIAGQWLDQKYGWNGMGAAFGALIGVVGWMTHVIFPVLQLNKEEKAAESQSDKK